MKCFHFTNGETREDGDSSDGLGSGGGDGPNTTISVVRAPRVSWARSFSVASSSGGGSGETSAPVRRSEFDSESRRNDLAGLCPDFLTSLPRANEIRIFTFAELKSATKGFNRSLLIGEGGFGPVYRGVVRVPGGSSNDDGVHCGGEEIELEVAVKQLNRYGFQGHKEWTNEVNWLGVIHHPNLVKLVGYCAEDDERGMQRLLVYELMKNKSLEDHLFSRAQSSPPLPWIARLKIARDAARGLAYLHEEMDFQLIFRDFKASNVLLDEDLNAKLSDFGLARLGPPEGLSHVLTSVVGTVGYAAPEYVQTGRLTIKSDVWSFGVVLYELITGRRALDRNLPRSEQKLLDWVKPLVSDSKKFPSIIDRRLDGHQYSTKSAYKLATLANKCLMKNPKSRPKMSLVVEMLNEIIEEEEEMAVAAAQTGFTAAVADEIAEGEEEETADEGEVESGKKTEPTKHRRRKYLRRKVRDIKERVNFRRKVRDIKERVNLRNKSVGKLDLKNWTPGLIKTW